MPITHKAVLKSFVLTALFGLAATDNVLAWGRQGHAIVAQIAEDNLTPAARSRVYDLLTADGSANMASVASWADIPAIKQQPFRPMHTVRMSMDNAPYSEAEDCMQKCVVKGLKTAEAVLLDAEATQSDQIVALKDLIHFTGDIHQPLHTIKNIGGQPVIFDGKQTTLHHVWDALIISAQHTSPTKLARQLEADSALPTDVSGGPEQWAVEGRDIAMKEIYSEVPPATKDSAPTFLPSNYADEHWPTVESRLKQGGLRLAATLNRIFANPAG